MSEENKTSETSNAVETPKVAPQPKTAHPLSVPIAIVIAGLFVAVAIFLSGGITPGVGTQVANDTNIEQETPELTVAPVSENDHILGNPNADVMIVEYSDYDCPFCKNFHETMTRVMAEYGDDGRVAWVYRHFPIKQLHPNAEGISEASECVAELGGNDAFWKFSNLIFDERGTNSPTDISRLPSFAQQSGVDVGAYNTCVAEGRYAEKIQSDVQAAVDAGARGTPYSVVLVNGKQVGTINGAQQYDTVSRQLDATLSGL